MEVRMVELSRDDLDAYSSASKRQSSRSTRNSEGYYKAVRSENFPHLAAGRIAVAASWFVLKCRRLPGEGACVEILASITVSQDWPEILLAA